VIKASTCPDSLVQLLLNFVVENSLEFLVADVMKMQSFIEKLNKMSLANLNRHRQKTIDSILS
jgi:hypothetical protein